MSIFKNNKQSRWQNQQQHEQEPEKDRDDSSHRMTGSVERARNSESKYLSLSLDISFITY